MATFFPPAPSLYFPAPLSMPPLSLFISLSLSLSFPKPLPSSFLFSHPHFLHSPFRTLPHRFFPPVLHSRVFIPSPRPPSHSLIHSIIQSFRRTNSHLFNYSLAHSFAHFLIHFMRPCLPHSPTAPFILSVLPAFLPSFLHLSLPSHLLLLRYFSPQPFNHTVSSSMPPSLPPSFPSLLHPSLHLSTHLSFRPFNHPPLYHTISPLSNPHSRRRQLITRQYVKQIVATHTPARES